MAKRSGRVVCVGLLLALTTSCGGGEAVPVGSPTDGSGTSVATSSSATNGPAPASSSVMTDPAPASSTTADVAVSSVPPALGDAMRVPGLSGPFALVDVDPATELADVLSRHGFIDANVAGYALADGGIVVTSELRFDAADGADGALREVWESSLAFLSSRG